MNIKMVRKQLFVLFSLFIGIMPLLTKISSKKSKTIPLKPLSLFDLIGEWVAEEETVLKIDDQGAVYLNTVPIALHNVEAEQDMITLQDRFGYNITITKSDDTTLSFYDEAEDTSFLFHKK